MAFNFRERVNQARRILHDLKSESAFYTPLGSAISYPVTVRHHTTVATEGSFDSIRSAEFIEEKPFMLLWLEQLQEHDIDPQNGDSIQIESTEEVFVVDTTEPPDGPTVRAWVI